MALLRCGRDDRTMSTEILRASSTLNAAILVIPSRHRLAAGRGRRRRRRAERRRRRLRRRRQARPSRRCSRRVDSAAATTVRRAPGPSVRRRLASASPRSSASCTTLKAPRARRPPAACEQARRSLDHALDLRPPGRVVPVGAADRSSRASSRHGAANGHQHPRDPFQLVDDHDRTCDVLHRRRIQQRRRPSSTDAHIAGGGVDGPRCRRLADVPPRHACPLSGRLSLRAGC